MNAESDEYLPRSIQDDILEKRRIWRKTPKARLVESRSATGAVFTNILSAIGFIAFGFFVLNKIYVAHVLIGLFIFTLIEYLSHRFTFHVLFQRLSSLWQLAREFWDFFTDMGFHIRDF